MKLNKIPLADTAAFSPSREAAWLGYKHTIPQAIEGALDAIKQKPLGGSGGHGRKFRHVQDKEEHELFWTQMFEEIERVEGEQGLGKRMVKGGGHGVPLSGSYHSPFLDQFRRRLHTFTPRLLQLAVLRRDRPRYAPAELQSCPRYRIIQPLGSRRQLHQHRLFPARKVRRHCVLYLQAEWIGFRHPVWFGIRRRLHQQGYARDR